LRETAWRTEEVVMTVVADLTELTAMIVACFASNNPLTMADVPAFIASTHAALRDIDSIRTGSEASQKPAVPIEDSITQDYLICLNDGQKLRVLKRYLQRKSKSFRPVA
jgi:predicted transcriptional regulator